MNRISAQKRYTYIAVGMTFFIFLLWWYFVSWSVLVVYLCAINVTTLLLYAFDKVNAMSNGREGALGCKSIAGSKVTRVPEVVLHGLALLGGSPMAVVGQKVFRHKTRKSRFQAWQYGVILVQVLLVGLYLYVA